MVSGRKFAARLLDPHHVHFWSLLASVTTVVVLVLTILSLNDGKSGTPQANASATPIETRPAIPTDSPAIVPSDAGVLSASPARTVGAVEDGDSVGTYQANWSVDSGGWSVTRDWRTVNGMLVNDGTSNDEHMNAIAPVRASNRDYAVEADVQLVRYNGSYGSFGVIVRANETGGGYAAGYECAHPGYDCALGDKYQTEHAVLWTAEDEKADVAEAPFVPKTAWHRYRLEVKGNQIKLKIDGHLVSTVTDNRFLDGTKIGLWCYQAQVNVRYFKLTPL